MRIIPIILLVLSLAECRHYFVRDAAKYNLTQEEENLLKSKKIGVIGFHPSYRSRYSDCCQMSKNIVRVLQFIYLTTDSESLPLKPNAFMKGIGKYRIFHKLSERNTFNELLKFRNVEENKHKPNKGISEENLRFFLKTYLDETNHLGYEEILNSLDLSDPQKIYLKDNSIDFWIIGYHSPPWMNITNEPITLLTLFPFIGSIGTFPLFGNEWINSNIWIFDKKLNLIKKLEFKNEYTFFVASWVFWQDETTSGIIRNGNDPTYIYEPDLKEFSKELAKIVRDAK
ncbi:MAG: hypothetical protein KBA66_12060 [Leptospiraceae bacterium]|nr:hypothetical protein [Leptospiraceae bacterium]